MRRLLIACLACTLATSFVLADPPSTRLPRRPINTMNGMMDQRVPNVEFGGVALEDVFGFLRDTGMNLYINWPALEAAGVDRSAAINLKLRNIKLGKVLDLALNQAAAGGPQLTWYVSDNIVYITTKQLADQDMVTLIYPIQDLLVEVPNFVPPTFTPSTGGQGGGGSAPFGTATENQTQNQDNMTERGEKIAELIMTLVEPDVWVENGGFARIRYFNGTLIVTAPRSVQRKIGG